MAYSVLPTVNAGDSIASSTWGNIVKANIEYLLSQRVYAQTVYQGGSNPTTTSDIFVDVDATNMKILITPKSSRLVVGFSVVVANNSAGNAALFDMLVGSTRAGDATYGMMGFTSVASGEIGTVSAMRLIAGLTPDTLYTIKLQWKRYTAGTLTLYNTANPVTLFAIEA